MDFNTLSWIIFGFLSVVSGLPGNRQDKHGSIKWTYGDNPLGPENWPDLFPFQCNGMNQSPVDIRTHDPVYHPYLREFIFTTPKPGSKFVVLNNGHYIKVNTIGNFYVYGGGLKNVYRTEQFHFHWGDNSQHGAEHRINGVEYPIELHIVSWNIDKYASIVEASNHPDGIAVLGVLFEVSRYDNPVLEPIIQAIPYVGDPDWHNQIEIAAMSLRNLVPRADNRFYRYQGSLTTPTCLESVTWTVYEQTLPISERQLNVFRQTLTPTPYPPSSHVGYGMPRYGQTGDQVREPLVNNYRPVQPLNRRTVYRSFPFLPRTQS